MAVGNGYLLGLVGVSHCSGTPEFPMIAHLYKYIYIYIYMCVCVCNPNVPTTNASAIRLRRVWGKKPKGPEDSASQRATRPAASASWSWVGGSSGPCWKVSQSGFFAASSSQLRRLTNVSAWSLYPKLVQLAGQKILLNKNVAVMQHHVGFGKEGTLSKQHPMLNLCHSSWFLLHLNPT